MSIPPISSMPSYAPLFIESVTPIQPEESGNPATIPLESDIINIRGTEYKLFKDINPDTHELEEGVFVKSPYPNIPALKLEGTEDLIYETRTGNDRREIFDNHAHHLKNKYVGFFPKESSTEDSYRCKRLHTCIGIFDTEGKLIRGIWEIHIQQFGFVLAGDFTYETTDTEQIIRCHGSFTTGHSRKFGEAPIIVQGTFEAKRQLQESFFYCSRMDEIVLPEESESRIDSGGTIRTGIFQGEKLLKGKKETSTDIFEGEFDADEMLICGSKTEKATGVTLKGLWHYIDSSRPIETISYCYGEKLKSSEKGSFYNTTLEMGKCSYNTRAIVEGRFFSLTPRYPKETLVTMYEPGKEPRIMWTILGKGLYRTQKEADQDSRRLRRT